MAVRTVKITVAHRYTQYHVSSCPKVPGLQAFEQCRC